MYHCTTSGNNVAGTYLVGHDTAKKGYDNNTNHPGRYIPCWEKTPGGGNYTHPNDGGRT